MGRDCQFEVKEETSGVIPPEVISHALCAVSQAQSGPQLHCAPQEHPFCCAEFWQPQAQPVSGQEVQVQRLSLDSFMMILRRVELTAGQIYVPHMGLA